jgi:homoaconitate hydratase
MSTEWGALVGWFPCDATTVAYLRRVHAELKLQGIERFTEVDLEGWSTNPPLPDPGGTYAARIELDLTQVTPHVSGPDTVQLMSSLAAVAKKRVGIQKAYLVSCVNSRLEDLEAAARVLRGKKIAGSVKFYLGAASQRVQEEAERRGTWKTLLEAGGDAVARGLWPVHRPRCRIVGTRRSRHFRHQP